MQTETWTMGKDILKIEAEKIVPKNSVKEKFRWLSE